MENFFYMLVGLVVLATLIIIAYAIIKSIIDSNNRIITTRCDWCGKEIQMRYKDFKWHIKNIGHIYCCGKCKREDEASQGVKEKRYRIFNE